MAVKLVKNTLFWLWGFVAGVFVCLAVFYNRTFVIGAVLSVAPAIILSGGWVISNWDKE